MLLGFRAFAADPVMLTNATATYSQLNPDGLSFAYPVRDTIDGRIDGNNGWSVFPRLGGLSHTAVFETVQDVSYVDGSRFVFVLNQLLSVGGHNLGRIRLSVTTAPRDSFADGLQADGQLGTDWIVLQPISAKSVAGTILTILPDRSILASGPNPAAEVYTVEASTRLTGITGIRLEVLADPSLPFGGPGRAAFGNFSLGEFRVFAEPDTLTIRIEVSELALRVASETNRLYQLQTSPTAGGLVWTNAGDPIPGTGGDLVFHDRELSSTNKLYRVVPLIPAHP